MLHLRVLGSLDLHDDAGRDLGAVLAQPKRLALLAFLAARPSGTYCRRDTLLAAFWPESDAERARTALRGALHFLRRALGADVIRARGDGDVGVDPALLRCDAAVFADAVDSGWPDEALAAYRGELLAGFFVADAPGFERWVDEERDRMRRAAAGAAAAVAARHEALGELEPALAAAWRAAEIAPDDETAVRRLLGLLDRAGDRAGAIRAYDALATRLAAEYDAAPSPETRARIDAIRRRSVASAIPADAAPAPSSTAPSSTTPSGAARLGVTPLGALQPSAASSRALRRALLLGGAVAVVAATWLGAAAWAGERGGARDASADLVAVLPFAYHGGRDLAYLGDGLPRLVSANLNGAGQLRTVDPIALHRALGDTPTDAEGAIRALLARFGAGFVVTGQVVESGGRVRITADVRRPTVDRVPNGAPSEQIVVDGSGDRVFELVDELTSRLVAAWGAERGQRFTSIAARTTHSLPALRAYLEGEREYAGGRYASAVDAYGRAVAADSTFALAYYRLSSAVAWTSRPVTIPAAERARHFVGRLSRRDSLLVEARYANSTGRPELAEQLYGLALTDFPDEIEAWYQLGEVRYHWAALLGRSAAQAETAFAQAVVLDPTHTPALIHLARLAASSGRLARFDSLRARIDTTGAGPEERLELDALHAFTAGAPVERTRTVARLAAAGATTAWRILPALAANTENLAAARAVIRALGSDQSGTLDTPMPLLDAQLALAGGRWRDARAALDVAAKTAPVLAAQYRAAFAALPFVVVSAAELAAARQAIAHAPLGAPVAAEGTPMSGLTGPTDLPEQLYPLRRAYLAARLAVRAGDSAGTVRAVAEAAEGHGPTRAGREPADTLFAVLLSAQTQAALAARDGGATRAREALRVLGAPSLPLARSLPRLPSFYTADERFLRAELLRAAGRDVEALAWYGTFPDPGGYDLVYLAPAHLAQATILDRLGRRDLAREHLRRFVALWAECDPELRPALEAGRRRLAALGG